MEHEVGALVVIVPFYLIVSVFSTFYLIVVCEDKWWMPFAGFFWPILAVHATYRIIMEEGNK